MTQEDERACIQTLMSLGLTLLQARVYLSLTTLGKAAVKTNAKCSHVARSDIYRVMPALEKLGLAEKILTKTTMYEATPIEEGLSILIQNRKHDIAEVEMKTSLLLNSFHAYGLRDFQEENFEVKVTSEFTLLRKMLERLIQSAQTSIDITIPWNWLQRLIDDLGVHYREAGERGVRLRVVSQSIGKESPLRTTQELAENVFTDVRYLSHFAPFGMHIFDEKQVTLSMSRKDALPSLYSINPDVVEMAEAYFKNMWNHGSARKKDLEHEK